MLEVHPENLEAAIAESIAERSQHRKIPDARRAPGPPEVEQNVSSLEIRQLARDAVQVGEAEIRHPRARRIVDETVCLRRVLLEDERSRGEVRGFEGDVAIPDAKDRRLVVE